MHFYLGELALWRGYLGQVNIGTYIVVSDERGRHDPSSRDCEIGGTAHTVPI